MRKFVDDFVDFGPGRIYCPSNIRIEYYKPLKKQVDILREDMLFVDYGNDSFNYVIDVGWYGRSFSTIGYFKVFLVKNSEWINPLIVIKCKSIKRLVPAIELCLDKLKEDTDNFSLLH